MTGREGVELDGLLLLLLRSRAESLRSLLVSLLLLLRLEAHARCLRLHVARRLRLLEARLLRLLETGLLRLLVAGGLTLKEVGTSGRLHTHWSWEASETGGFCQAKREAKEGWW